MIIWAAAATAAAITATVILTAYRRQVRRTCRQLTFINSKQTNLRITSELPFPELNELTDGINEIVDISRRIQKDSQHNEENLKEIITNLSHDIRTPLTSMDGYFQLLLKSDKENERDHYISIIQNRITSLKDMLEELFTYTKLQNENYRIDMEVVDFAKIVFDTVFSFYDEFEGKDMQPQIDFFEGHLPVSGNAEAIRRVIQNIIKNALEHGRNKIRLALYQEGAQNIFCCENDMTNQEQLDMERIFSRFYKADSARGSASAGLGLAIAKELTERMNGSIAAFAEENIFRIEIRFDVYTDKSLVK